MISGFNAIEGKFEPTCVYVSSPASSFGLSRQQYTMAFVVAIRYSPGNETSVAPGKTAIYAVEMPEGVRRILIIVIIITRGVRIGRKGSTLRRLI